MIRKLLTISIMLIAASAMAQQPTVFVNGTPQYTSPAVFSLGLKIVDSGGDHWTVIQGGNQAANLTYTLPTAYPAVSGYALTSTDAGVLSWANPGPAWDSLLNAATGDETAFNLAYTVNKATSGNDTGLLISMTDTASPGTSKPLSIQTGAAGTTEVFSVGNDGGTSILSDTSQLKLGAAGDVGVQHSAAGVVKVTDGSTGRGALLAQAYLATFTSDSALQVGMIVAVDESHSTCGAQTACVEAAPNSTDKPVGLYVGTGAATAHASTEYTFAVGGKAYVAPIEGTTVANAGDIVYAQNDAVGYAGYAEFAATVGTANHNAEVGHVLRTEEADLIDSAADAGDTITILDDLGGWAVGDPVIFWEDTGASVSGLTSGAVYFIKTKNSHVLTLSATLGGDTVPITADFTASNAYLMRLPLCIIHFN